MKSCVHTFFWILMGFWNLHAAQCCRAATEILLMYLLSLCRPDFTRKWHQRRPQHASATYFNDFSSSDSYSDMNHVCSMFVLASALVFCTPTAGWHRSAQHLHGAGPAELHLSDCSPWGEFVARPNTELGIIKDFDLLTEFFFFLSVCSTNSFSQATFSVSQDTSVWQKKDLRCWLGKLKHSLVEKQKKRRY